MEFCKYVKGEKVRADIEIFDDDIIECLEWNHATVKDVCEAIDIDYVEGMTIKSLLKDDETYELIYDAMFDCFEFEDYLLDTHEEEFEEAYEIMMEEREDPYTLRGISRSDFY